MVRSRLPLQRILRRRAGPEGAGRPHLLALALAAALGLLFLLEPFRLVENRLFDILSTVAPPMPEEPGVVIVAIDEPSFAELGQRWPWPRALHGKLIRTLREAGAKAVAVDILFAEPSGAQDDQALAASIGPDVVLSAEEAVIAMPQGVQTSRVEPLQALLDAGARSGSTSVDLDADAYLRRLPETPDSFAARALEAAGFRPVTPQEGALIQYFGPARTYPTISYYQALEPERFLPPGRLRGKTVFVGLSLSHSATANSGASDAFPTAYTVRDKTLTSGVEVQATLYDNLRTGLFVTPLPWAMTFLAGLAFAAAASLVSGQRSSWRTALIAAVWFPAIVALSWVLLRHGRVWAPPALPLATSLAAFASRVGLDYARERRLRRAVSDAFSRYLSPAMVDELSRNPQALRLGGERRTLTILFCDVRGFTEISERLREQPERLTSLINRLLEPLSAAVLEQGGTIDKYIGDCVMAFWNAPLASPNHAVRAVRAGESMLRAVDELNAVLLAEEGPGAPRFAVGVGVNTGDCVVGNFGSPWRFDYSVLGDPVNLASRIEGLSKAFGAPLLVGEETAKAAAADFVFIELDRIAVKGRQELSPILAVVGERTVLGPAADAFVRDHARLLDAMRTGEWREALALATRLRGEHAHLAGYFDRIEARVLSDFGGEA
ncbi:adenylate/guanylate cyclase domain-containing protein [Alsobacter metallidurans]|uniref:Adenylate/guanylate cyclase domain-containing protein n=1 Tax=Alsobacter metallidurans TaxID=340221 RepID=A0A917MHT8_9HYPH|nr:adenylate/guanylate cyclase domain-containing protein [Alsobacter metallidurans]GGH19735.1 adenylate/guanylate cyclase domain-containing protein [Alsobacter metallidurans]